jgi:hypothetical protein
MLKPSSRKAPLPRKYVKIAGAGFKHHFKTMLS